MKQKMVVKVFMPCEKCRTKAMKIAAATEGVNSVALDGKDQDQLVVTGDGIDSVHLARKLRKKVGQADIVTIEEKKEEKKDDKKGEKKEDKKDEKKEDNKDPQLLTYYYTPPLVKYEYEPSPSGCRIL